MLKQIKQITALSACLICFGFSPITHEFNWTDINTREVIRWDGDTAIIKQAKNISNARIAAVLVKGNEVTLKKIKFDQSKIRLIPANSSFKEMEYKHSDIEIQGELKGILRKYN